MNYSMKNKKPSKGILVLYLMIGLFLIVVGAMGFIRSPEITDVIMLVSGFIMAGAGVYKLVV